MQNVDLLLREILNKDGKTVDKIIAMIKKSKNIAVFGHIEPDGDTIGAQLALYEALKDDYNIELFNEGPYDNKYISINKKYFKKTLDNDFDLYIIVDTPSKSRIGSAAEKVDFNKSIIIDHHITNDQYGHINWIDVNFISSAEMVFLLLYKMNIGINNPGVCQNLLNGIVADNGLFRHIRKDKYCSLYISYLLIKNGADPVKSYNMIFGWKSLNSKKLLSLALQRLESYGKGKIYWTYITDQDKKAYHNSMVDSSSVFNEIMSINGIEIAIFFKVDKVKEKVDISFRSIDNIDVSSLAQFFGGGGHIVASGTSITGEFEEIKKNVLKKSLDFISKG
jgi:phosphoesterase RecJ-like protein